MSTVATSLTSWEEFLTLPDAGAGGHYELHDGQVILVPPPRPLHVYVQSLLVQWLTNAAQGQGRAAQEFPYRPAKNLQFWHADVAYIPNEHWEAMRSSEYPVYSPPLVIEVLSPSNKEGEIDRQRVAAFSGGTREFWVIDLDTQSIEVSIPGSPTRSFGLGDAVSVSILPGVLFPVSVLFPQ
jgi:Uma2 family endonuclease